MRVELLFERGLFSIRLEVLLGQKTLILQTDGFATLFPSKYSK